MVTEIAIQPVSSIAVIALEDVTLSCSASVDDVTYSWHRVDGDLPLQSQGENRSTFTIHETTPFDQGMYYCMVKKNTISVKSDNALVHVDGKEESSDMPFMGHSLNIIRFIKM